MKHCLSGGRVGFRGGLEQPDNAAQRRQLAQDNLDVTNKHEFAPLRNLRLSYPQPTVSITHFAFSYIDVRNLKLQIELKQRAVLLNKRL